MSDEYMQESDLKITEPSRSFLVFCRACQRKHKMVWEGCPVCGDYDTAQPMSETVYNKCLADYSCGSCDAVYS